MTAEEVEQGFQEVWRLFKETDRRFKDLEQRFKETDRRFQETDKRFQETDRKIEAVSRQIQETDRELRKMFEATDRQLELLGKRADEMMNAVKQLTGKWGYFVEGLVLPAVEKLFNERGIKVDQVYSRARRSLNGDHMEIDILAHNEEYVVAVEVKSTLTVEDVKEHIQTLKQFKTFFPLFRNHKLIGAVAGIVIHEDADRYAYKQGLFVIGQSGETVRILNDEKFVPRIW